MRTLPELRRIAEAATPGPWKHGGLPGIDRDDNRVYGATVEGGPWGTVTEGRITFEDALHIATFDPPTVLALLDVAEDAHAMFRAWDDDAISRADQDAAYDELAASFARLREVTP